MIKITIIDNQPEIIEKIIQIADEYFRDIVQIASTFPNKNRARIPIKKYKPDLVLSNSLLETDKSPFSDQLTDDKKSYLLYIPNPDMSDKPLAYYPIDIFPKPCDPITLAKIIIRIQSRLMQRLENKTSRYHVNSSKKLWNRYKITLPTINGLTIKDVRKIIRCQADINYTHIFTEEREKLTISKTLKEFEQLLAEPSFFRVHNSHLVNLDFVSQYIKGKGGYLILADNTIVPVSCRRKEGLMEIIKA